MVLPESIIYFVEGQNAARELNDCPGCLGNVNTQFKLRKILGQSSSDRSIVRSATYRSILTLSLSFTLIKPLACLNHKNAAWVICRGHFRKGCFPLADNGQADVFHIREE